VRSKGWSKGLVTGLVRGLVRGLVSQRCSQRSCQRFGQRCGQGRSKAGQGVVKGWSKAGQRLVKGLVASPRTSAAMHSRHTSHQARPPPGILSGTRSAAARWSPSLRSPAADRSPRSTQRGKGLKGPPAADRPSMQNHEACLSGKEVTRLVVLPAAKHQCRHAADRPPALSASGLLS
jgi:hypothetical protein